MLTGTNGILSQSAKAKEETEIASEKEQLQLAMASMNFENETNLIKRKEIFKEHLNNSLGNNTTSVYIYGNGYIVHILTTDRIYAINENGEINTEDKSIFSQDPTPGQFDGSGNSEEDPYVILSIEDLVYLSNSVNSGTQYRAKYFKIGKTLDFKSELSYTGLEKKYKLNEETLCYEEDENSNSTLLELMTTGKGFIAIGKKRSFYATFDGGNANGYELRNLYEETDGLAGLFGNYQYGNINNLTITGKIVSKGDYIGGIVGRVYSGNIENCISYVEIISEGENIGGISGSGGTINNCKNYGNIKCNQSNSVGGISGANNGKNSYCYNYGKITGVASIVGGISGIRGENINCKNYGEIEVTGNAVGGIAGRYSTNTNCENYGNINVNGNNVGGIIGGPSNGGKINKCKNYGEIKGLSEVGGISSLASQILNCVNFGDVYAESLYSGGIEGYNRGNGCLTNSCNLGKINGNNGCAGGLVGRTYTYYSLDITNCYNVGEVISEKASKGELIGEVDNNTPLTIDYSYWNSESALSSISNTNSLLSITNSRELTSSDMKKKTKDEDERYTFLEILNNYVDEYNAVEENTDKLVHWIYDEKTGYPIPNCYEE